MEKILAAGADKKTEVLKEVLSPWSAGQACLVTWAIRTD